MENRKAAYAIENICFQVAKLDAGKQAEFIDILRGVLEENEIKALQIGIAYFRMIIDGGFRNAMQAALASELYKEFRRQVDN